MGSSATSWMWAVSNREHGKVVTLAVCQALTGAFGVAYALLLRGVVDSAVDGRADALLRWLAAAAALLLAQQALRTLVRWLDELTRSRLENTLKAHLLDVLLHGESEKVRVLHSSEWVTRLTSDTKVVADGCTGIIPGLAGTISKLVGALALITWLDRRLSCVLLLGASALVLLTHLFRRTLKQLHKRIQEADERLRAFLQEHIAGVLTVQSFSAEEQTMARATSLMDEHLEARMRRNRFWNLCNVGFGTSMAGASLLAAAWCAFGILNGTMTFGTLTAMLQLVSQVQVPFAQVTGYLPQWYATLGSAERLRDAQGSVGMIETAASLDAARELYDELSAFGLDAVSYSYPSPEGDPQSAVCDLTLSIGRGEFVALAGRSGCGKSTTLRLLMGACQPSAGTCYLEPGDGSRINVGARRRRLFAYVPQGNELLGDTIREAVTLADPHASHDETRLWQALHVACADEFVRDLEGGVDAPLGERGSGLSEGQAQRLAVARAIFSGSPVLLLDEATSALDAQTEAELLHNLQELENRTIVLAAHRPSALAACNRVIRFDEEDWS